MNSTAKASSPQSSFFDEERSFSNSTLYRETVSGKEHLHIPLGFETAKHIEDVVFLTRDLLAEKVSQCASGKSPVQRFGSKLDERLQLALRLTPAQLQEHFPKHRLHPYVELFLQCADREYLFERNFLAKALTPTERDEYAAARQRMLSALRADAREPKFRRRVKAHQDKVRRNLNVIRRYTDAQFRHSKVLVIRVDCLFVDGFALAHDWAQARLYREALIKYINRDLPRVIQPIRDRVAKQKPEPIAGYIIGTEYGIETGWHFHVTLFLNGNRSDSHVGIASRICWAWKDEITSGNGRYFNCNLAAKEGRYNEVGVGMIHRNDLVTREILVTRVTRYTVKGCYYAEAQTGTKDRLLNKGGWPKEKDPTKGGRPESRLLPMSVTKKIFFPIPMLREPPQPRVSY